MFPRLAGGGGGAGFDGGGAIRGIGELSSSSCIEFCVRFEPLLARPALAGACLRDAGGGGGAFFAGGSSRAGENGGGPAGVGLSADSMDGLASPVFALASGGGGSGLFRSLGGDLGDGGCSIPPRGLACGGGVLGPSGVCQPCDIELLKSANDTVCGPLAAKAFPCLCFGGGGGPSASGRVATGPIKLECSLWSSSSESDSSR